MIDLSALSEKEKRALLINSCVMNDVKKVKIKNDFDIFLKSEFLDADYSDEESIEFFNKYKGEEVFIMSDGFNSDDFFIIEDCNYVITRDCFEDIEK